MGIDARLGTIGLVVADMAASLAFYRRLGLDVPVDADTAPHVEVALPGGLRLAWDTEDIIRHVAPDWTAPHGGNRTSLAFRLPDPAAVDAAYTELTAAGYHGEHAPWDTFWGQRYAVVHDPDGLSVDLFAPSPACPAVMPAEPGPADSAAPWGAA
jgi:catechol 2,3-dioxygenase-like lactoylglutathione lyase family enzyme